MASVKHTLQRDLFLPNDERLISLISVYKPPRKRKGSYLCAVLNTTDSPIRVFIYQVKKTDRGDAYKKKLSWLLRDLRNVDGRSAQKETTEFDLQFEKIYSWATSSVEEKEGFLSSLWRLSQRYLIQKPTFVNIPEHLIQDINKPLDQGQAAQDGDDISIEDEDYQALSAKEESDLERLMSSCQAGIANAEVFADQLSKELSVLDGANIHSIMGSEDQVLNLMRLLDDGIKQAEMVEQQLNSYDTILENVKEQMEVMKDKDMLMTIRNTNHHKLTEELNGLVSNMDLDLKHMSALLDGDLQTPNGIYDCAIAAQALYRCMNVDMDPALKKLGAVEEQQKKFGKISATFSKRLIQHLNNLFIHQGNQMAELLSRSSGELKMPQHDKIHKELIIYSDLMYWLKTTDPHVFDCLSEVYCENLSKLYVRELQEFLDCAKQKLASKTEKGKHNMASMLSGSSTSLEKVSSKVRGRSPSMQSIDSVSMRYGSETDIANRNLFDSILEKVFVELERVCLAEQDFCDKFFHLSDTVVAEAKDGDQDNDSSDIWTPRKITNVQERQINDSVRSMLGSLFPSLEHDIDNFIMFSDRQDGLYSMYMLVRMTNFNI
ncbi:exocyst complex component 1 [Patella vulgata]|uniref:exocyst complex component 1 n=1 Tax=Patella vulgata TaxID=6465 RepID=UPI0024A925C4|nr:exocyst complex component 1 [Patella vulgata]